ncbi:hypothetical protein Lal_00033321 [Lupinus albus]|nr:hypothetical protein Lal_00033321 [Lupinus albus]
MFGPVEAVRSSFEREDPRLSERCLAWARGSDDCVDSLGMIDSEINENEIYKKLLLANPKGCSDFGSSNAAKKMSFKAEINEKGLKKEKEKKIKVRIAVLTGDGKLFEPNDGCVEVDILEELLILDFDNPIDAIVCSTYPKQQQHYKDEEYLQSKAILASTIEIVDQIKDYVLSIIPVDISDVNDIETISIVTPEFLNTLSTSGLSNHKIKLKVGTPIMLLRNLDQAERLYNGTRLMVTRMAKHVLDAKN